MTPLRSLIKISELALIVLEVDPAVALARHVLLDRMRSLPLRVAEEALVVGVYHEVHVPHQGLEVDREREGPVVDGGRDEEGVVPAHVRQVGLKIWEGSVAKEALRWGEARRLGLGVCPVLWGI